MSARAEEEFIERMGLIAQADGLPRIAGRVMAFLVLHGGPVSFGELASRLGVSRGSISTNTRLLEGLGVVERVGRPGDRGDWFRLADAPYRSLLEGIVARMARAQEAVDAARRALPPGTGAQERLDALGRFYARVSESNRRLIDTMKDEAE